MHLSASVSKNSPKGAQSSATQVLSFLLTWCFSSHSEQVVPSLQTEHLSMHALHLYVLRVSLAESVVTFSQVPWVHPLQSVLLEQAVQLSKQVSQALVALSQNLPWVGLAGSIGHDLSTQGTKVAVSFPGAVVFCQKFFWQVPQE
jgi:hypothetical protein